MIFLKINCPNFSRFIWRRHIKFQIGAIPLAAPLRCWMLLMCVMWCQLDRELEESRRVLKQPQSPPLSEVKDVMEISRSAFDPADATDERQDAAGAPLDLSRHSPHPRTPPSGLTAATAPVGVGPVSPCQGARPPSRSGPGLTEERRSVTEALSQLAGSALPAASPSFTDPNNIAHSPIATQVTAINQSINTLLKNRQTAVKQCGIGAQ